MKDYNHFTASNAERWDKLRCDHGKNLISTELEREAFEDSHELISYHQHELNEYVSTYYNQELNWGR